MTFNDNIIDPESVEQIIRCLPTDDEVKKLNSLTPEEITRLGKADIQANYIFVQHYICF